MADSGGGREAAGGGGGTLVTQQVCREDEMGEGEMREVEVAGHSVLLLRECLQFRALGSRCPHAGAPLSKGYLAQGRLRCPWHGACFSTRTGDIEEYPTLDCLPAFKVTVDGGQVYVTAGLKDLESSRRVKAMSPRCPLNPETVLVLGAGPAALTCAETLRQEGFTGRILLATRENHLPYDRTKLSKEMAVKAEGLYLRPQSFLDAHGIEVWLQKEVVSVDPVDKSVQFRDGSCQAYDSLLVATGSSPRLLQCPGSDLQHVFALLTPEDAARILASATGRQVVIVGASFIGMEVAASLVGKASSIHVVDRGHVPYQLVLGEQVGRVALKMLQAQGVQFHLKAEVEALQGQDGKVSRVVLAGGHQIPADVVVVGIGVVPNTAFLQGSSIALDRSGAVLVDLFMQTSLPSVFAAGDVASFPVALLGGECAPIRHWQIAQAHGHVAALNILGRQKALHTVPFFWTRLQAKTIRYAGCGRGYTDTVLKGSLEQETFLLFYISQDSPRTKTEIKPPSPEPAHLWAAQVRPGKAEVPGQPSPSAERDGSTGGAPQQMPGENKVPSLLLGQCEGGLLFPFPGRRIKSQGKGWGGALLSLCPWQAPAGSLAGWFNGHF
uniref:L-amino-acid oxidase n=1 Tax=Pogona vitticeps TaxID=103695 RepID=A0ABM5ENU1_9SAUR